MIKIENENFFNFEQLDFIIQGMRNPLNSWERSDSELIKSEALQESAFVMGAKDLSLMRRLSDAGTEHRKYMRMMPVYARITAPLYW